LCYSYFELNSVVADVCAPPQVAILSHTNPNASEGTVDQCVVSAEVEEESTLESSISDATLRQQHEQSVDGAIIPATTSVSSDQERS
jgi:hypothetical protein